MTPEQLAAVQAELLKEHLAEMRKLAAKALSNTEKWGSVIPQLAERFVRVEDTVANILKSLQRPPAEPTA